MSLSQNKNAFRATRLTVDAYNRIKLRIRVGMSEKQIAEMIDFELTRQGSEKLAFPTIVAIGTHSADIHHIPCDRKVKSGDNILIDMGGVSGGMRADFSRTLFMGYVKPYFREWYEAVLEAQKRMYRGCRVGRTGASIDAIGRGYLETQGLAKYFLHSGGHGVGKKIHQAPWLSPVRGIRSIIREGIVLNIEPGVYMKGKGGLRLEDTCEVLAHKARWFVRTKRDIQYMILPEK